MDAIGMVGNASGGISPGNVKLLKVLSAQNGAKITVGTFSFLEIHMYGTDKFKAGMYVNPILYMPPNQTLTVFMSNGSVNYSERFSTTANSVESDSYTNYCVFVYSIT